MKRLIVLLLIASFASAQAQVQWGLDGQVMQRLEYRHGYGMPILDHADPSAFIGQRSRIGASVSMSKAKIHISFQDVRVWGVTANTQIFEAYTEIKPDSAWTVKLGRQVLNYDNQRFLGGIDWSLSGKTHDFGLVKYEKGTFKIHAGGGFNQDGEKLNSSIYTQNQYKVAQMLWAEKKWNTFAINFLAWNNGRQVIVYDSLQQVKSKSVKYTTTLGLSNISFSTAGLTLSGYFYYQLGKDISDRNVTAYNGQGQITYRIAPSDTGLAFQASLGAEILSGTATNGTSNENKSYDPMYGTNHAHNGYMDLFYVGGRHVNSVGLLDAFLRLKLEVNPKLFFALNTHYFQAAADVMKGSEKLKPYLGTELDLAVGFVLTKDIGLQGGYSHFLLSDSFKYLRNASLASGTQNWAYIMLTYRPQMKQKFAGLLF